MCGHTFFPSQSASRAVRAMLWLQLQGILGPRPIPFPSSAKILLARVLTLSSAAFFRPTYTSGVLRTRKPVH